MNKSKSREEIIQEINNMLVVVADSPELFHDGIDEELLELLADIKKYIILNTKEGK